MQVVAAKLFAHIRSWAGHCDWMLYKIRNGWQGYVDSDRTGTNFWQPEVVRPCPTQVRALALAETSEPCMSALHWGERVLSSGSSSQPRDHVMMITVDPSEMRPVSAAPTDGHPASPSNAEARAASAWLCPAKNVQTPCVLFPKRNFMTRDVY